MSDGVKYLWYMVVLTLMFGGTLWALDVVVMRYGCHQ